MTLAGVLALVKLFSEIAKVSEAKKGAGSNKNLREMLELFKWLPNGHTTPLEQRHQLAPLS